METTLKKIQGPKDSLLVYEELMKTEQCTSKSNAKRVIIKKCHMCGTIMETTSEPQRCSKCNKSFLPLNYFSKVHAKNTQDFKNMFTDSDDLHEEDLIKGLLVLW